MKRGYPPKCIHKGEVVGWHGRSYWVWDVSPYSGCLLRSAVRLAPSSGRDRTEEQYQRSARMKREDPSSIGVGRAQPSANGLALEKIAPTLARYMLDVQWDDGDPRIPSIIQKSMEDGLWAITLQDRNYARILKVRVDTWSEMIPALEAALNAKPAPWQHAAWMERYLPKTKVRKKS